tara:strand:- start:102 stop:617 length:516 start_codon:yes stop_codon:yes gene_type:complete
MKQFLYFIIIFSLISCSNIKLTEPRPEPKRETIFGGPLTFSTETGSFSTKKGTLSSLQNSKNGSLLSSLPVNELLWKSSLDTLEFMSFKKIDPLGGVIVSDWFISKSSKNLRNKITISFSSSELKATSIKVSVIREIYENKKWVSDGYSDGLARKIEELILSRARELRQNS